MEVPAHGRDLQLPEPVGMQLRVLGSAAGGGFPQWNCGCPTCQEARVAPDRARPRTQSSIAVRSDSGPWYLVNASPDVRAQLELLRDGVAPALRSSPVAGVLLTDAEIDHTAGLLILRESHEPLRIHGTAAVRHALRVGFPVLDVLDRYCGVEWSGLEPGDTTSLPPAGDGALEVEAFPLPGDAPLYMRDRAAAPEEGTTIGLTFRDPATGGTATYAPGLARLDTSLLARLEASDLVLLDGTFWRNDELPALGVGTRTALDMGHLPLSGAEGSMATLRGLRGPRKVLVHVNNSNPILLEHSAERLAAEEAGLEVGYDGMRFDL